MKRITLTFLVSTIFAFTAAAQSQTGAQAGASAETKTSVQAGKSGAQASSNTSTSASAQSGQNSASLSSGTTMNAALNGSLDARKNKPGDTFIARTTDSAKSDGKVIIPKGSKLVGHVTEAKARAKGESQSSLGIVFDKAILRNGQEIPLNVAIQAVALAETAASSSLGDADLSGAGGAVASGRASGGGALGGVTSAAGGAVVGVTNTAAGLGGAAGSTVNSTLGAAGSASGAVGGLNAAGNLASNSRGVIGLNGLNLSSAASSSTQGSLITSAGKNVHLDSGTRMLLVSQGQAQAAKP